MTILEVRNQAIKTLVRGLFKNKDNTPYELTDGQCEIWHKVTDPFYKWVWLSAPTRYGKSEILAMALMYVARFYNAKIPIVGGSKDKADKIMEYIIQHLDDHEVWTQGLLNVTAQHITTQDKINQLKITMSKEALRWSMGGWIYITSVDSRNKTKGGEGVVGEGGDIVVLEEAGLIKDESQFSKIVRMPERGSGWGKLIMSGNCVEKSVFETAFKNSLYTKVRIDLQQSVDEGRYTWDELEEKKSQTTTKDWKRYYLVQFPEANEFSYFKPRKYEVLPRELTYYGALDPSLGETKKASKSGIIVIGVDANGQKYEVESIVEHLSPDEAIRRIFNLPYVFKRFYFEAIQFQKYFLSMTKIESQRLGLDIPFEGVTQARNKLERIESLEPPINTGQILFKGDNQLWLDMQDYPETEYLDGIDALEMAYKATIKSPSRIAIGDEEY